MALLRNRLQIDQADSGVPLWRTLLVIPSLTWTVALQAVYLPNATRANKQCNTHSESLVTCRRFLLLLVDPILSLQCKYCQHCARDHTADKNQPGVVETLLGPLIGSLCLPGSGPGTYISKPSSGGNRSSQSQSRETSGPPRKRKRLGSDKAKRDPEEPPDGDGEPSGAGAPSKHPSDGGEPRGLKCPYYQRRPEAHQRTSCKVTTYENMPRLKQHIERVHTKPLQCDRCFGDMPSKEALKKHIKMDPPCDNVDEATDDDRVTKQWLKDINLNQLPFSQATCVSKKWNLLYDRLFPGEANMPECYEEPGMTAAEERRFIEILAQKLAAEFGGRISERFPTLAQQCKQEMQGIKKHIPQSKIQDNVKTQITPFDPDLSSIPWLNESIDAASGPGAGASSARASPQLYLTHPGLDSSSHGQVEWPPTSDQIWMPGWSDASPMVDQDVSEPPFYPKDEYHAEDRVAIVDKDIQMTSNGVSENELELEASKDEDAIFKAFVEYPPKQEPRKLEPRLKADELSPRDGG